MNLRATMAEEQAPGGPAKFTYAGGDRPLEGFTIKRGVGRGGFGEVYYALSDAGKEVALKLIRRNLEIEIRGVTQCLNLKHPNLVGLYDIRKDDAGDAWVVMEYVRCEPLDKVLEGRPEGLPLDEALWWIHGIGAGVAYLHDHGIVHRDLKPGNIFNDEGVVKIGDYGLSKFISVSRRSGQTESVGTVHYMAPEIANGRYGKEIDIYALGVMLYEMLTGRVPFDGESVAEVLMKHLTAEPDLTALSEPYRTVVKRALAKDPARRYSTAREFLADLPRPPASDSLPAAPAVRMLPVPKPLTPPPAADGSSPAGAAGPAAGFAPAGPAGSPFSPGAPHGAADRAPATATGRYPPEPIAAMLGHYSRDLHRWWNRDLNSSSRAALLVVGIMVLVTFGQMAVPFVAVLGVAYAAYFVVRLAWLALTTPAAPIVSPPARPMGQAGPPAFGTPAAAAVRPPAPRPPPMPPMPAVQAGPAAYGGRARPAPARRPDLRALLLAKTGREKATELMGALLFSAGLALSLSILTMFVIGNLVDVQTGAHLREFTWLAIMSTAAAWGVLIPAKIWESREGEPMVRRFVMLIVGLALGTLGWLIAEALFLRLPDNGGLTREAITYGHFEFFDAAGMANWKVYLTYFGFLFPVLRWWKQADPLRRKAASFGSTLGVVLWAYLLTFAWPFPQPWGIAVAGIAAIAVQGASPWISYKRRQEADPSAV